MQSEGGKHVACTNDMKLSGFWLAESTSRQRKGQGERRAHEFAVLLASCHLLLSGRINGEEREKGINQVGLMYPLSVSTSA